MNWGQPFKQINDLSPIRVRQNLIRGGNELSCPNPLSFTWEDLVLSLARTTALLSAVPELSHEERQELARTSAAYLASHMNLFVDAQDDEFLFTTKINILADEQRTSLAAKLGAVVADLVMQRMGFHWSANTRELALKPSRSESTKKIPDFVYDPAGAHGFQPQSIVVVEAKGSLSTQKAKRKPILNLAQEAYNEQVRHIVGAKSGDLEVASGYAIAFGTIPGARLSTLAIASPQVLQVRSSVSTPAHSLSAAASYAPQPAPEPAPKMQHVPTYPDPQRSGRGGGEPPGGGFRREGERREPSGLIAYANYESVFLLCGATNVARVMRNSLSGQGADVLDPEGLVQDFWVFERRGKRFWTGRDHPFWWWPEYPLFAIYEQSAKEILRSLSDNLGRLPRTVSLTVAPIADGSELDRDFDMSMQGDGLALLHFFGDHAEHRRWDIRAGNWLDGRDGPGM
ncbi:MULTISPECIES: hypothetical protein [unclassified Afipia]|uniref:hypothetical protein n=1 Tax=unclassified Afipia TaxID=2642050 RepID=UPI001FCB0924|nr:MULTISPECIES: hypothetical protein [unclassified Afipia]